MDEQEHKDPGLLQQIWNFVRGDGHNESAPRKRSASSSMFRRKRPNKKNRGRLPHTDWISGIMLCGWDNIFGPHPEQVRLISHWLGNAFSNSNRFGMGARKFQMRP